MQFLGEKLWNPKSTIFTYTYCEHKKIMINVTIH